MSEDEKVTTEEESKDEEKTEKDKAEEENAEDIVKEAVRAAERIEDANKKHEELVVRQEALQEVKNKEDVEKKLGGKAAAGFIKKEETDVEYKDRIMKGE